MDQIHLSRFLKLYAENKHTDAEHQEFIDWMKNAPPAMVESVMDQYLQFEDTVHEGPSPIFIQQLENRLDQMAQETKSWRLWPAVAAAVIVTGFSIGFYFYNYQQADHQNTTCKNDLSPGGPQAVLTLADGSKISLSEAVNGQLATQAGLAVSKTSKGEIEYQFKSAEKLKEAEYNTITTPPGGQYQVRLPDGTKVWLNAASSLKYPVQFAAAERRVELTGEAYFEVAKNKKLPFIVNTNEQKVRVLGTHFNINSYAGDKGTETTLLEGSVSVSSLKDENKILLTPGQQSLFEKSRIKVSNVNAESAIAWQKGLFSFNNADLKTIMSEFARWYNVEVVYNGKMPEQRFTGEISRQIKASQFLDILSSFHVEFHIEGKGTGKSIQRIIVTSKK